MKIPLLGPRDLRVIEALRAGPSQFPIVTAYLKIKQT